MKDLKVSLMKSSVQNDDFLKLSFLAIALQILSTLTMMNYYSSFVFVMCEDIVLLYFLLKKRIDCFIVYYLMFLSVSIENGGFILGDVENYYGFKNLHVLGLSNNLILLLLSLVIYILRKRYVCNPLRNIREVKKPFFVFLELNCVAIIIGFLNLLLGDNGAVLGGGYFSAYAGEVYYGLNTVITLYFIYEAYEKTLKKENMLHLSVNAIIAIALSQCYGPYICYLFGIRGDYGGSLLTSYSKLIVPFILLFAAYYSNLQHKLFIYVSVIIIGEIIPILFFSSASGKDLAFLFLSVILFVFFKIGSFSKESTRKLLFFLLPVLLIVILWNVLPLFATSSLMFSDKIKQLYSLVSFSSSNYLDNMMFSPQVRVYELLSVGAEYLKKPWYAIFGKGYAGAFSDHLHYFMNIPAYRRQGAFSNFEFANNYFYKMHEFARMPLTYGITGVLMLIMWLKKMCKKITPLSILGMLWILLFINNTQTLAGVLMLAFVSNLYEVNENISY